MQGRSSSVTILRKRRPAHGMDGETNDETEKSLQPASLQETSAFFDCRRFLYYPGSGFWNFGGVGIWYVDPERKQAFDTADERCER